MTNQCQVNTNKEQKSIKPILNSHWLLFGLDVDGVMVPDAVDTVICIQVLVQGDLEHRGTSLAIEQSDLWPFPPLRNLPAGNDAPGQEKGPDSEPSLAILLQHLVLVGDPVLVPAVDCSRIMNTQNINILNLKSSRLELITSPMHQLKWKSYSGEITFRTLEITHPKEHDASAPGNTYLFINKPQTRSSYCQKGRMPAT